jgi:hypothetical protein
MRAEHRYHEGTAHGRTGLLRLVLTNDGPPTHATTGDEYAQPDVLCHPSARQARRLADHLTTTTTRAIA